MPQSGQDSSASPACRKRLKRYEIAGGARFITFSCQHRLPLFRNPKIADLFVESMAETRARHGFELFAWVVMPEHIHLLVCPSPSVPLDRSLLWMKLSVSKQVLPRWREMQAPILERLAAPGASLRFWQKGGGFDRNIRDQSEFMSTIQYIHRNPIERGLVDRAELWKWSSVRWWMGERENEVACDPPPGDSRSWAGWRGFV